MNLLLILSALLTSLTGAAASGRPIAPQALSCVADARQGVIAVRRDKTERPGQTVASLAVAAVAPIENTLILPPAITPLYASRRRE